jgi:hypothetical protein
VIFYSKPQPVYTSKLWRMDKMLVARSEATFPDRCIKCNAPANGLRLKRVIHWQPSMTGVGMGAFIAIIICAIWMAIVQKKAKLQIGICRKHCVQRYWAIIIGWAGTVGGLGLMIIGTLSFNSGWCIVVGLIIFAGFAIYGGVRGQLISATMSKDEYVLVKGVCRDFLAGLPNWPYSQ